MTYESMIDELNESTQFQMMQYVIESIGIESLNEGFLDSLSNLKNRHYNFWEV